MKKKEGLVTMSFSVLRLVTGAVETIALRAYRRRKILAPRGEDFCVCTSCVNRRTVEQDDEDEGGSHGDS